MEDHSWSPVRLVVDRVDFALPDTTAGSTEVGQYTVVTKDGLTRVSLGGYHVAMMTQGRWGLLLTTSYDPPAVCVTLPAWAAQAEKDEATDVGGPGR